MGRKTIKPSNNHQSAIKQTCFTVNNLHRKLQKADGSKTDLQRGLDNADKYCISYVRVPDTYYKRGRTTIDNFFWKNYFESTEAIVWVVDSLDESRLKECEHQLHELLLEEKLLNVSLLILANKSDAAGSLNAKTIEQLLHLNDLKSRHYCIFSVSALTGEGIQEAIKWLASDLRESKMGLLSNR
ncbi:ADP-ribosylation factor Alp41 [Schizosaccharomyces octosporus yFS286]|uniref:ADP-ribosylation factor Alp41 n=1 Tax=Schizosaccharomyces octosporus (strain yFS286) TaxID=483514 RepID=S9R886_SCHOY|nr:ADP-ribosylation factor Alp41 [Schizosaccharomyces octosporus yFS286]EPX74435.1 ADP-ribosylation factor Alp41 [Schizosaccharomyces octosporus yFS286]